MHYTYSHRIQKTDEALPVFSFFVSFASFSTARIGSRCCWGRLPSGRQVRQGHPFRPGPAPSQRAVKGGDGQPLTLFRRPLSTEPGERRIWGDGRISSAATGAEPILCKW